MTLRFSHALVVVVLGLISIGCGVTQSAVDGAGAVRRADGPDIADRPEQGVEGVSPVARQIVADTNAFRVAEKLAPVELDVELLKTAQYFASFMADTDKYGHQADGKEPADRASDHGYDYCMVGENIAYLFDSRGFSQQRLVDGFVNGWKNSPPHRKNMLDPDVTQTGVAVAQSAKTGRYYAVQLFGRPRSASINFSISNTTRAPVSYSLDGQTFELHPRMIRKHGLCRPGDLVLQNEGPDPATISPKRDATYVVRARRDGTLEIIQQ